MARAARPVNPDDGPIQSFAFDLRILRESAGNPTYRSLARTAGFSATTLGDAAGGVKLPTLEVTLAYVVACGGDTAQWQKRWQSVNRGLAVQQGTDGQELSAVPDAVAGPAAQQQDAADASDASHVVNTSHASDASDASDVGGAPDVLAAADIEGAPRGLGALTRVWRAPKRVPVRLAALALVAVLSLVLALSRAGSGGSAVAMPSPPSHVSSSAQCPAPPSQPAPQGGFLGQTYGAGANVRSGASLSAPVRERLPAGCALQFSGFCLGDVVKDTTADTPDMRWFILPGVGEVASAVVHGNPPSGMGPQPCPDSVPRPASITLSLSAAESGGGVVGLRAAGGDLWIVGFAAYYGSATDGGSAQWHQLGMTASEEGSFGATLRPGSATAPVAAGIPVAAVACLGGDGATEVVATGAVSPGGSAVLRPYPLGGAALAAAEQAACRYPTGA